MKHILLFNKISRASIYGIGTYIRELTDILMTNDDMKLHLVQLYMDEGECKLVKERGCNVYYFPKLQTRHDRDTSMYYRNVWYTLCSYLNIKGHDSIILHLNYYQSYRIIPFVKKQFPDVNILFTIHYQNWCFALNGNDTYFRHIIQKKKKNITNDIEENIMLSYEIEKKVYKEVDSVICLSKFTQNLLVEAYGVPKNKTTLIYNGLKDEGCILSSSEKAFRKNQLKMSSKEKIILYVGRLEEIKGIKFLIRAFVKVAKEKRNIRLIIIGDGEHSVYMEEAIGYWDKITFTGYLKKEYIYKFYQIADMGILPSFHEQCSYVAIEMMMFNIPIIVVDTTGATESVIDGQTGFILPVLSKNNIQSVDINLLADKIKYLLKNDLKQYARMNYLEKYNYQLFKEKMLFCYRNEKIHI